MAAQILFKIACPSCDAQIPVRDASLVGRKVACPTCKYPFKVENPDGFEAVDGGGENGDVAPARKAKKKSGGNGMKIGLAIGGLAVVVLAVAGYFLFFSGDEPKKNTAKVPPQKLREANPAATTDVAANTPAKDGAAKDAAAKDAAPTKDGAPTANASDSPTATTSTQPANPTPAANSSGDITNMLPNESVAVTFIDVEKFRFTTLGEQLFESKTGFTVTTMKERFGIDLKDMLHFVRGENIEQKWSFNVLRTKTPIKFEDVERALHLEKGSKSPILGRAYWIMPHNPFLNNLTAALLSDEELAGRKPKPNDDSSKMGLMLMDETTVVIANLDEMEEFMKSGCSPHKLSKPTKNANDPNTPSDSGGGNPSPKPGGGRGGRGMSESAFGNAAMTASAWMQQDDTQLTENATYLTIDPPLKAMIDRLHNDPKNPSVFTFVFKVQADKRLVQRLRKVLGVPTPQALTQGMKIAGLMLNKYELEKFYATIAAEFFNENDVKELENILKKRLDNLAKFVGGYLGGIKVEAEGGDGVSSSPSGGGGAGKGGGGGVAGGLAGISTAEEGPASKLKLIRKGRYLMGIFELNLVQRAYGRIATMSESLVARTRGMVDMASPTPLWKELSAASVKLHENGIPRATFSREDSVGGRLARVFPPQSRVGWMAGLLPHLGHDDLYRTIDTKKDWRYDTNLKAGARIVPEFLDPRYPDRTWYANLDSLGDHVQASTHYVGIAGVGMDAADYKADDESVAKKIGAFNYDRPTPLKDVTDGLSNTIFMIQVPPNYQRPWIAGGGATTMGIPESRSIRPFVGSHAGKKGTFVIMLDGSVRFISETITDDVFKALCTIKGGESIDDIETVAPKVKSLTNPELKTETKDDKKDEPSSP